MQHFKKIMITAMLCLASLAALSGSLSARELVAGSDYTVLEQPLPNAKGTLTEVFSYECPHCYSQYQFDTLGKVKEAIPSIKTRVFQTPNMGTYGKELARLFAYAGLENKDASDKKSEAHQLEAAYFTAYYVKKARFGNGSDPQAFYKLGFAMLGIDKASFEAKLATPKGKAALALLPLYSKIASIYGTPSFVVNGKYLLNPEKITSMERLVAMVKELLKK